MNQYCLCWVLHARQSHLMQLYPCCSLKAKNSYQTMSCFCEGPWDLPSFWTFVYEFLICTLTDLVYSRSFHIKSLVRGDGEHNPQCILGWCKSLGLDLGVLLMCRKAFLQTVWGRLPISSLQLAKVKVALTRGGWSVGWRGREDGGMGPFQGRGKVREEGPVGRPGLGGKWNLSRWPSLYPYYCRCRSE